MNGIALAAGNTTTQGAGGIASFLPLILIFIVFYFLLIRPQQKKAKEHQSFLSTLKKGDEIVTNGGIHGRITGITDSVLTLEIAEGVRVKVNRASIMTSVAMAKKEAEAPSKK